MNIWYFVSFPALFIIAITAAARLADMGRQEWDFIHHVQRIGMIGVGAVSAVIMIAPQTSYSMAMGEPGWRVAFLVWPWAITWMAKSEAVPWWDFILGVHRRTDEWKGLGVTARLRGELRALGESFKPRRFKREPYPGKEKRRAQT